MKFFRSMTMLTTLFAFGLSAYASTEALPSGCGDATAHYNVKTNRHVPLANNPSPDTGRIVFIESLDGFNSHPVVRFAINSKWVGADKGPSYFAQDVAPGHYTVCASREGSSREDQGNVAVLDLTIKPGQTAFVNMTITRSALDPAQTHAAGQMLGYATPDMTAKRSSTYDTAAMDRLPADKGTEVVEKLPASTSTPK